MNVVYHTLRLRTRYLSELSLDILGVPIMPPSHAKYHQA